MLSSPSPPPLLQPNQTQLCGFGHPWSSWGLWPGNQLGTIMPTTADSEQTRLAVLADRSVVEPTVVKTPALSRNCCICALSGKGTKDILDGRWYCASCAHDVLDSYSDKQLATDIRFLRQFAKDDETDSTVTHNSFQGVKDPGSWIGQYCFPDEEHVWREYAAVIANFFRRGRCLCHQEMLPNSRLYCGDWDVLCPGGRPQQALLVTRDEFISLRLQALADIFRCDLEVAIFEGSGHSRKYNQFKISRHLVFNFVVNEQRSAILRQHWLDTLEALAATTEDPDEDPRPALVKRALEELLQLGATNTFEKVFDASVTVGTNGLRLPYCDKADVGIDNRKLPPDNRPLLPVGVWVYERDSSRSVLAVFPKELSDEEWIMRGMCRRAAKELLTEWSEPTLSQPLKNRSQRRHESTSRPRRHLQPGQYQLKLNHKQMPPWNIKADTVTHELSASGAQSSFLQGWSAPHTTAGVGELVVLFHDGSRGEHGVGGAATLTLYVPGGAQKSKVLCSEQGFLAAQTSAAGGEYFALLLGLQTLVEHSACLEGRRLVCMGDATPIVRHLESNEEPSKDCEYLLPLVALARQYLQELKVPASFKKKERSGVISEHKAALASLRSRTPTCTCQRIVAALQQSEDLWNKRTNRVLDDEFAVNLGLPKTRANDFNEENRPPSPKVDTEKANDLLEFLSNAGNDWDEARVREIAHAMLLEHITVNVITSMTGVPFGSLVLFQALELNKVNLTRGERMMLVAHAAKHESGTAITGPASWL